MRGRRVKRSLLKEAFRNGHRLRANKMVSVKRGRSKRERERDIKREMKKSGRLAEIL